MKRMKKIVSMLLAVIMVLGMCITASAEGNCSITIKNNNDGVTVTGKKFTAYQILEAELANGTDAAGGVVYKVPGALADFYAGQFNLDKTATGFNGAVVEAISGMSASDLEQFAKEALNAAKSADGIATKSVTVDEYVKSDEGSYWKLAENGGYTEIAPDSDDAEGLVYESTTQKYALNTQTEVTIDDLPLGYYVVEDEGAATPVSALALTSAVPNAQVVIKASQPWIDKKIDGNSDSNGVEDGLVDSNEVAIGDTVPFVIKSSVPNMSGYKKYYFVVTDSWVEGLTFKKNSMNITIGGEPIGVASDSADSGKVYTLIMYKDVNCSDESITTDDTEARAFKIIFHNFIQYKSLAANADGVVESAGGAPIEIKYDAVLNEKANIGALGNENSANLEFSNNPNTEPGGDPNEYNPDKITDAPTGKTPESTTRTYVTGIKLTKVDAATRESLTGATFKIEGTRINQILVTKEDFSEVTATPYWELKTGGYTSTQPARDTKEDYVNPKVAYINVAQDVEGEEEPEEWVEVYWLLKDGTYTTQAPVKHEEANEETNAPEVESTEHLYESTTQLYKRSEEKETLTSTESVALEGKVNKDGILEVDGLAAGQYTITEIEAPKGYNILAKPIYITISWTAPVSDSEKCTWTVAKTVGEDGIDPEATVGEDGIINMTIGNSFGALLPSTGGIGTTIFYVVGGILVLAAVVLLVTKKRMSTEK